MRLELDGVSHSYDRVPVLRGIDLALEPGQIGCLLGQSGSGKTTVLRCIAGFEQLDAGTITVGQLELSGPATHAPPETRGVGMVFQHYALFGHLDVAGNVGFGLRKMSAAEREARVQGMLELTGLSDAASVAPHELSGGQRQRVALARALAPRPSVLLLDEPFSNLDQELRYRLSAEVRGILKSTGTTALLVTHDQFEAFAVADDVAVMHEGRIVQSGRPHGLYHQPASPFVAGFIGRGALLEAKMIGAEVARMALGDVRVRLARPAESGAAVQVLLRPEDVAHDDDAAVTARVVQRDFRGADVLFTLELPNGERVLSRADSSHDHAEGSDIGIRLVAGRVMAFPVSDDAP